jgi:aspartate kinase
MANILATLLAAVLHLSGSVLCPCIPFASLCDSSLYLCAMVQVFKFGGASIESAARIRAMADIIKPHSGSKLLLIISALGKTTNALENVAAAFNAGNAAQARELFSLLEAEHNALAQDLMATAEANACIASLQNIYAEADWILHGEPERRAQYYYDQLVCLGEMMSTTLVSHFFNASALPNKWFDVRDVVTTDDTWQEASIDWQSTQSNVNRIVKPLFVANDMLISQGFVGCTTDNESTTLGREGSDYTAAVFSNMLDAASQTIWKDVPSLLSGDPKIFEDVVPIPEITYYEVIEMSYYGAQVIHPKTIKPLQNKMIPLYVKCFLDSSLPGTVIKHEVAIAQYPPILVLKPRQTLLEVYTKDLSFITDDKLSDIYDIFHSTKTHINVLQSAAVMFLACIDTDTEKIAALHAQLADGYRIEQTNDIELITIRHHTPEIIEQLTAGKQIILQQKGERTIRVLAKVL